MYPSSTSSSSQGSMGPNSSGGVSGGGGGLMRYGSAPGSLLNTAVDSVIGRNREFSRFFSSEHSDQSICKDGSNNDGGANNNHREMHNKSTAGLQRSYGFNEMAIGGGSGGGGGGGGDASSSGSGLIRHSSSPAGFLNHLASAAAGENGFSITRGIRSHEHKGVTDSGRGITRLNSQLSFTRPETLSRFSEETANAIDDINSHRKSTHSYANTGFGMGTWDDNNTIMFSASPNKRPKNVNSDIVNDLNNIESQFHFGMPETTLEMTTMDKLLNIPEDSVPCKIRAKRGCATHPRSIAERERRTRISGKLKKLQDLVPNMDKQTSYADMLDLAVQHIKTLQNEVQTLNKEVENCTCGCKKAMDS